MSSARARSRLSRASVELLRADQVLMRLEAVVPVMAIANLVLFPLWQYSEHASELKMSR